MDRFSIYPTAEKCAAPEPPPGGVSGVDIRLDDTAQTLRDEYFALLCSLVTIWFGFVVITACGYVLSSWLAWTGEEFDLSKPILLWLPVAIIALSGPVWLPVTAYVERRDLQKRLALLAERDGRIG